MPLPEQNYYAILGVPKTASADEIHKAYRKLARRYHPDLNPGNKSAEERFKMLQEAYRILRHPLERERYDQAHREPQGEPARARDVPKSHPRNDAPRRDPVMPRGVANDGMDFDFESFEAATQARWRAHEERRRHLALAGLRDFVLGLAGVASASAVAVFADIGLPALVGLPAPWLVVIPAFLFVAGYLSGRDTLRWVLTTVVVSVASLARGLANPRVESYVREHSTLIEVGVLMTFIPPILGALLRLRADARKGWLSC